MNDFAPVVCPAEHKKTNMENCKAGIYFCNQKNIEKIKQHASFLTQFLKETSFLTEAYILDFFVEDLWSKLPSKWTEVLFNFEIEDLEELLNPEKSVKYKQTWPLSLLAFRASVSSLSISRKSIKSPQIIEKFVLENYKTDATDNSANSKLETDNSVWNSSEFEKKSGQHKDIPDFCRKHVKPKKQHEIFRVAQTADAVLRNMGVKHLVDVGSGQGHLSRFLAFCFDLKMATVEANGCHVSGAEKFDKQAFSMLKRKSAILVDETLPHHLNHSVSLSSSESSLEKVLKEAWRYKFAECDDKFGLIGLHTCGNLCETILKTFVQCEQSQVVLSVGCCYMKMDSVDDCKGFPGSSFVKTLPFHHLSYEARELACHALEIFTQRLIEHAPKLKIHCYRATLEKCILQYYPDAKHLGLRGVKHAELLSFNVYAEKALSRKGLSLPVDVYSSVEVQRCLDEWKKVLIFYSVRLMTAPVVESLILIDRLIFLFEQGCPGFIAPIFDPLLSPRNQILISLKNKAVQNTLKTQIYPKI